jgi:hypothetical protein
MFIKQSVLSNCPYWRNTNVNPFLLGKYMIEDMKGLCPYLTKHFSSRVTPEKQPEKDYNLTEDIHESKCPYLRDKQIDKEPSPSFDYNKVFKENVKNLKEEGRYRQFIDVQRQKDKFPTAVRRLDNGKEEEITIWCSNDYLGMGQHPKVVKAMMKAIE